MAELTPREKAESLAVQARAKLATNDRDGALLAAKQALQLCPQAQNALDVIAQLQSAPDSSPIVKACTAFTSSWSKADHDALLRQITSLGGNLGPAQADKCLGLIVLHIAPDDAAGLLDSATKALLLHSPAARKALAQRCSANLTVVHSRFWDIGEKAVAMLLSVVLDKTCWPAQDAQDEAIKGVFQLDLARLIGAGEDHMSWAIDGVVLIARAAPKQVKYLADADAFSILLECLDMRRGPALRRGALTAIKLLLEVTTIDGEKHLQTFVTAKVKRGTNEQLIQAFSAASGIFPILPAPAAQLFMTEGFLQGLMPKLIQNTYETSERRSTRLQLAALELLSAVCQDKACRAHVAKYSTIWLQDVAESSPDAESAAVAALILAKTYQVPIEGIVQVEMRDAERLASALTNMLLNAEHDIELRAVVEAISYVSMEPRVKKMLADNSKILQRLVQVLQDKAEDKPLTLGVLVTFTSLVQHKPRQTDEQKKVGELKAYAEASKPIADDFLLADAEVHDRCKKLREARAVPAVIAQIKTATPNALIEAIKILFNMSQDPASHGQLVQQGAVKALMQTCSAAPAGQEGEGVHLMAAHALARILTSVNPEHTFSNQLPAINALKPLTALLPLSGDLLPVHDALRALTNLASMPDAKVGETMIKNSLPAIEELMLSSNERIQQAATELVCNLMTSPHLIALYADGSGPSKHRLTVLLALTDAASLPTRRAAAGALAMLTQYEQAAAAVLDKEGSVRRVLGMCGDGEGDEMLHRGLVVLGNLLSTPGGKEKIQAAGGQDKVKMSLRNTRNPDILAIGVEILKILL